MRANDLESSIGGSGRAERFWNVQFNAEACHTTAALRPGIANCQPPPFDAIVFRNANATTQAGGRLLRNRAGKR